MIIDTNIILNIFKEYWYITIPLCIIIGILIYLFKPIGCIR